MHFVNPKGALVRRQRYESLPGLHLSRAASIVTAAVPAIRWNHDFEDIEVKQNAPELLENALCRKRKKVYGGNRRHVRSVHALRGAAEADAAMPGKSSTGTALVRRSRQNPTGYSATWTCWTASTGKSKAVVQMTLTTYDEALCRLLEPKGMHHAPPLRSP